MNSSPARLLAFATFFAYFILIVLLFLVILISLRRSTTVPVLKSSRALTFIVLTLASLIHTWYHLLRFMEWSFIDYEKTLIFRDQRLLDRLGGWLMETRLFEQAWSVVCFHPINWWWSEQICLFTAGAWTVFVSVEGRKRGISFLWAYMLLGQLVAISVAANLFYLALALSRPSLSSTQKPAPHVVSPSVWLTALLSLITIGIVPFTSDRTFLPNLLIVHALQFIPLIIPGIATPGHKPRLFISLRKLYLIVTLFAFALRARTVFEALSSFPARARTPYGVMSTAWSVLHSHPAQSSIGWDVIWTTVSFLAWAVLESRVASVVEVLQVFVMTTLASVGVAAPWVLGMEVNESGELKLD